MANLSNINNYFVVDTTGKVAIGDVSAATMPTLLTQLTLYDNTATASLVIQSGAASGKKYELGSSSTGKFQITDLDASIDRLTVDTTGNVGIGTTTPYQKLDVVGTIEAGDISATDGALTLVQRYNAASGDYIGSISTQYSSGAMILGYGARGKNGSGSASFTSTFDNFSGIRGALRLKNGELSLYSSISATQATVGSDLSMTNTFVVQSDGNVGIGTTSPASKAMETSELVIRHLMLFYILVVLLQYLLKR
jgi:hypothetical protein